MMKPLTRLLTALSDTRRARGFWPVEEMVERYAGNVFLDPFSTLISREVVLGRGNLLYPSVVLECAAEGAVEVGDDNVFYPGSLFLVAAGRARVGNRNQFGEGGFTARLEEPGAELTIGDAGRYLRGASLLGRTTLGSGSQVLGPIDVRDCRLGAGDSYASGDPDKRGAVLKGFGTARGLSLARGSVIEGPGRFGLGDLKPQSFYHPKPVDEG